MPHSSSAAERRVAYVLDTFPTVSETFVLNEILELQRRGREVMVFSVNRPNAPVVHAAAMDLADRCHYDFARRPSPREMAALVMRRPLQAARAYAAARTIPGPYTWLMRQSTVLALRILESGCTRIHGHFATVGAQWAMCAALLTGRPYTFTTHGPYDIYLHPPPGFEALVRHAQRCITVSAYNRSYIERTFGVPEGSLAVVPCGIDAERFMPSPEPPQPGHIVTVGRLTAQKGMDILLEAAGLLHARGTAFHWTVVGDGPQRPTLEARIAELGLEGRVELAGWKTADEVRRLLQRARVFALASVAETQGVVYLEAMASEVPVVGTAVMGVPEVVTDGETGYLVPPHDPAALADRIAALLQDPELARRMGGAGRDRVIRHFSLRAQVDGLLAIWEGGLDTTPLATCPDPNPP